MMAGIPVVDQHTYRVRAPGGAAGAPTLRTPKPIQLIGLTDSLNDSREGAKTRRRKKGRFDNLIFAMTKCGGER